jgi:thioesterase domain-containing protein
MTKREDDLPVSAPVSDDRTVFPCTPTQERFWFLHQLRPDDPSANVAVLWEIKGSFDSAAFEQAFRIIVQRHEILRTCFLEVRGAPMQEIAEDISFNLSVIDLSILPPAVRRERASEICTRESQLPFDLGEPPLIRATMMRLEAGNALLLIVVHHAVFDGWSIGVLARELGETVAALRAKRPHALPALQLQYADYALWFREYFAKGGADEDARYWQRQLRNLPYFEITPDHTRPEQRSSTSGIVACALSVDLGDRLEAAGKSRGVSFFTFGCAIIAAMLQCYTQQSEIVIGTQVAGRNDVDLEPLIGAFVNNLVLRFDTSSDQTFSNLVMGVAETVSDALIHQSMPFDHLVRLLNHKRDVSRTPLYAINVILQPAFMEDAQYGDFSLVSAPSPSAGALFDLNFHMVKRPNGWRATLEYNADLYERTTAQGMFDRWIAAMEMAVSKPSAILSEFGRPVTRKVPTTARQPALEAVQPAAERLRENGAALWGAQEDRASTPPQQPVPTAEQPQSRIAMIEQKLLGVWREVLQIDELDREDNFFELGGHSLSALSIIARASALFGVKADPMIFFRAPTIAAFSHYIEEASATDTWRVVPVQPNGSKPPLIAISGGTGYHNLFYNLAKNLGTDQPFFSIHAFDPHTPAELVDLSMEEIAAEYVRLIRSIDPSGPYVLVGHCAFGLIAFEAARQLREEGKSIQAIIMFDTWAPSFAQSLGRVHRSLIKLMYRWRFHKNRIIGLFKGETTLAASLATIRSLRALHGFLTRRRLSSALLQKTIDTDWFLKPLLHARANYRPAAYEGDVIVFHSDDNPKGRLFDPNFGWRNLVKGRLDVQCIGGSHMTMGHMPRTALIAKHIRSFLGATSTKA